MSSLPLYTFVFCRPVRSVFAVLVAGLLMAPAYSLQAYAQKLHYPATKTADSVDIYHGTRVPVPYRWLENQDSEATRQWVAQQNDLAFSYLEQTPERERIRRRLRTRWDYPRYSVPEREAGHLFFSKNEGLQNQPVVYVRPVEEGAEPHVLFDPNTWSDNGTASLSAFAPGPAGRYVAYGKSRGGSDWKTLHVRDLHTGEDLRDSLRWVKFNSPDWTKDGKGFYYGRYPAPKEGEQYEAQSKGMKIYYHEVGTPQSDDRLVYERPDNPRLLFRLHVTHDGRYLVIAAFEGSSDLSELYVKDLHTEGAEIEPLIEGFDAVYELAGASGSTFYLRTTLEAPNGRIVEIDARDPARSNWTTIVPESDAVIQGAGLAGGRLVVKALDEVKDRLTIHALPSGTRKATVELPTVGTISANVNPDHDSFYYGFRSFTYPQTIYRYDLKTGTSELINQPKLKDFDPAGYVVRQVFFESTDGTKVPMFLVYAKGIEQDGTNPTLLYGYGGFGTTVTPSFWPGWPAWLEMGGVLAVPNLRGGGAYGEAWHQGGMRENRQQAFDDFASAALYLIDQNYTSRSKLAILGVSNGGLLTGASITQRPNLFGAAIVSRGVLDMLRYHKFTIGHAWIPEFGSSDDPEQFEYLYDYSPLHNVKPGTAYPPTLITTADTDDRVVPLHSYKFAAALQAAQVSEAPILLRVETGAGHGGGTPTSKQIEEYTDVFSFIANVLDMNVSAQRPASTKATEH